MKMTVQDSDDTLSRFSRRSHRKSRAGCGNCKRRRVKCDEKKPICSNCSGRALECTYSADYIRNSTSATHLPETKSRFRPYSIAHNSLKESEESPKDKYQATSTNSVGVQCSLDIPSACTQHISLDDLLLFHHFIVSTYMTLGDRDFWQIHVPQWGVNFPSIQHLILALSALHLSHKCPSRRDEYVRKADDHFTFGLQSVRAVLAYLNSQTCQQVYISSALICFVYFARGPIAGEYLVFGDHGPSEWRGLLNGVKLIMESHRHEVFTGVLAPKPPPTTSGAKSVSQRTGVDNHLEHVRKMRTLIQQNLQSNSDLAMYNSVIDDLLAITAEVYEKRSSQCPQVDLMQLLIGWVYRLPDEFVNQLEQKQSMSLVVLAYWAMLLKNMQSVWFMKGWDVHVMKGICASLPSQFQQWIQWPVQQLEMDEIIL